MDWPARMQLAIAYIEENLDADISIAEAAVVACSSKFHFHRMFSAMFSATPAEYIRKRRLTLAASELLAADAKVIDVAAKYGFDSANAFTRAFKKLHGVNPGKIAASQFSASAYNRATSNAQYQGDQMMEYRIVEKPAFQVIGKSKAFEFEKFAKEGAKFWKDYVGTDDYTHLLALNHGRSGKVSGAPMMSVYFPDENGSRDAFIDVLGIEKATSMQSEQFETYQVPAATYAEFNCTYSTSMKTNRYIYGQWFAATGFERDGSKPDIAAYFPLPFRSMKDMGIRWWIPVVKKG